MQLKYVPVEAPIQSKKGELNIEKSPAFVSKLHDQQNIY